MVSRAEPLQEGEASLTPGLPGTRSRALYLRSLDRLGVYTRGNGAEALRVISFLFAGGLSALVNLLGVWLFARYTTLPHAVYIVLATEISLLCSFVLNDRFTFRALIDGRRSWWLRCIRFHGPSAFGFVFTLLVSDAAYYLAHLPSLTAQAVALILATVVNFSFHRFWTYRTVGHVSNGITPAGEDTSAGPNLDFFLPT